jgi:hypothetical protein
MWVVNRNPYLQEDLINNKKRWKALTQALYSRLNQIRLRANGNKKVLELLNNADQAVMLAISSSVSGVITTAGYSTRQSVASVAWDERDRASKRILLLWVTLSSAFLMRVNNADQAVDDFKSCLREFKNNKTRAPGLNSEG